MAKFRTSMLKQTLTPVVLVVAFWVSMSSATTYYLFWAERSQQRAFTENTVSMRAAESLQFLVSQLAIECPDKATALPGFRLRWSDAAAEIELERQRLAQSALTEGERQILLKLDSTLTRFVDDLKEAIDPAPTTPHELANARLRAIELAGQITSLTHAFYRINQDLNDQDTLQSRKVGNIILWVRFSMLTIGPLAGIFLGWRLATRLNQSLTRISVTLHGAHPSHPNDVDTVAIESFGDFEDVVRQAELVAERMRQVNRDLQTARHEVLQSERLAAVGELAAGVAHEIRNPLTSVKLLLQHAVRQASGPILDESKLRLILDEIGRMESTVQGLLDFSRPPLLNRAPHDLRQTLRRACNLVDARARQQRIEIIMHITETPLIVDGDTEKLHQVFTNLMINAIEAMPEGGRMLIETSIGVVLNRLKSTAFDKGGGSSRDKNVAQITIQDTGEGIANDLLPRLFEPFATTKERGTGLGLAVSRRIVEEHYGTIHACNVPGGGARFTLNIPLFSDSSG